MTIPIHLQTLDGNQNFRIDALLDSGSTGSCINEKFVKENGIPTRKIARPMPTYNADRTLNSGGSVMAFIGHDWLKRHNPAIN